MGVLKTMALLTAVGAVVLASYMYWSVPPGVTGPWKVAIVKPAVSVLNLLRTLGFDRVSNKMLQPSPHPNLEVADSSFSGVQVRIYKPRAQKKAQRTPIAGLMYFHGGGWVGGSVDKVDGLVRHIADETGAVVVSVEYRLAPEYKFPVPFQDCLTATKHFLQHAIEYGVDPTRIGVAGESSGGNLAAAVALKLNKDNKHDKDKIPSLKLQALINPPLQAFDFQTPSHVTGDRFYVFLSRRMMVEMWIQYLNNNMSLVNTFLSNGHTAALRKSRFATYVGRHLLNESLPKVTPEDVSIDLPDDIKDILNPYYAPLMAEDADLSGLPNTYIVVCGIDVLRDDGIMYAKRLEMAGVQVKLAHYPSGFHGIILSGVSKLFQFEVGKRSLQDFVTLIRQHL